MSSLLNIRSTEEISLSSFKGPLFECLVISDFFKQFFNAGKKPSLYYWRDANGRIEVDCLFNQGAHLIPIEIKSSESIDDGNFQNLIKFHKIATQDLSENYVVYEGPYKQKRAKGTIIGWQKASNLIKEISTVNHP